jgi:putative tricarboxylic transport membrane protein
VETFVALAHGMSVALQPMNLLFALIGVFLGTAVGVLPGIGPALTVALLLPVTYKLDPAGSLIMFAGIYYGGMYGGSTTAILINTPGESASMATALEGNKMAKAGRGGPALATAAIGSFVAGLLATLGLAFLAPWLVEIAVQFGPEDYFALMCVAFITVSATFGDSPIRGLTSLFIGLALGLIGIDKLTGQARLAFGVPELLDGVEVTTLAVGLFAVGEALFVASRRHKVEEKLEPVRGSLWMTKEDWRRSWKPWLRGVLFGFPIGALPAGGAEIPTFLSYSAERRLTKYPDEFGKGAIEGVAGPEAANNASAAGTLVPLLTLGLPTSATAAMMLAGFQQYGLNPGPLLFAERPDLVWGLIASLFIANAMLLILNLPLVGLWVRLLAIPQPWLYAGILVFATMGTIAAKPSVIELGMLVVFGIMGFLMRRFDYPIAPVVVGLILGPVAENQLRRALSISLGDPLALVQSPISAVLLGVALIALVAPFALKGLGRFKTDED